MFDLAILGSGFGGSLMAMVARRLGLSVVLLERGAHPRFAIGESTSPLTNLLLEELADRYDLPRLRPLSAYGTWKQTYPEMAVGLKRGFSYYLHEPGQRFVPHPDHARQLLVAASPKDELADTHWYRPDFDHFLVREAEEAGAEYLDHVSVDRIDWGEGRARLEGTRGGRPVSFDARFVIDATGPRGALSRLLGLNEVPVLEGYPHTEALFSHFTGVGLFEEIVAEDGLEPPYHPDDAALHHVFDGGWMWVLRFENGITSAGFAVEHWLAEELDLADREGAWARFLERFPSVGEHFRNAKPVLPFIHSPRLSYRCEQMTGDNWAMLPSAAAFVDPLFSTGFPLTLLGIHRLGRALEDAWNTAEWPVRLQAYGGETQRNTEAAARLVAASYATFRDFPRFIDLSMLYFAAASYSEMARRLGHPELAAGFLLSARPEFDTLFRRHCEAARAGSPSSDAEIAADLEPFNIAGLCEPAKRNWYGVDAEDVVRGAAKLGATETEVRDLLARMGC